MKIRWSPNTNREFEFEIPDEDLKDLKDQEQNDEIDLWVMEEFRINVWPDWEIVDE